MSWDDRALDDDPDDRWDDFLATCSICGTDYNGVNSAECPNCGGNAPYDQEIVP